MPLPVPTSTRRRLAFLFSVPLAFSLVFFLVQLAAERADIYLLEIQNLQSSVRELRLLAKQAESSERGFRHWCCLSTKRPENRTERFEGSVAPISNYKK